VYTNKPIILQIKKCKKDCKCLACSTSNLTLFVFSQPILWRLLHVRPGPPREPSGIVEAGFFTDQIPFLSPNQSVKELNGQALFPNHYKFLVSILLALLTTQVAAVYRCILLKLLQVRLGSPKWNTQSDIVLMAIF